MAVVAEAAMIRAVPLALALLCAAAAGAETPPAAEAPEAGRVFCRQSVGFHLADRANVPQTLRRFLGVWSDAAWDARTCAALIVEDVQPDGTASIVYVYGPLGASSPVRGG